MQLKSYIFQKHVYRIPLGLVVDLGLVNFSMKTDTRIIITLERNMNKLFESNQESNRNSRKSQCFYDRPYISCQEISLTKGADLYFTGILIPETALRQGILPSPNEQLFEVNAGTQDYLQF